MLKEKWTGIIFHIQNKHIWTGNILYHQCSHGELSRQDNFSKDWISAKSQAFQALQSIVFDKTILKDMAHSTKFSYTGIYHSVLKKWISKSTHFSYKGMVAQCKLGAIEFNQGQKLEQAKTMSGNRQFNVCFSKVTKSWVAKPIKEEKSMAMFSELVDQIFKALIEKTTLEEKENIKMPKNIAAIPNLIKKTLLEIKGHDFLLNDIL